MESFDISPFQEHLLDLENSLKTVKNLQNNQDIVELTTSVNHLAYLLVSSGVVQYSGANWMVDVTELRRAIRWYGFFIKKLQASNRSFFCINRWNRDILMGKTSREIEHYRILVMELIEIADWVVTITEKLDTHLWSHASELSQL